MASPIIGQIMLMVAAALNQITKGGISAAVAVFVAMKPRAFCKQIQHYIYEFSRMARFTNNHSLPFPVARNWNTKDIRALKHVVY